MSIAAVQAKPAPYRAIDPGMRVKPAPGRTEPQAVYQDRLDLTPRLRWEAFVRTVRLVPLELFGGHTIAPEQVYCAKGWQRLLHRLLPGGLVEAACATPKPVPAAEAIANGPIQRPVDARAWMPNVHFEKGEGVFPVDPGFDGDGDVTNNRAHYRPGQLSGNQELTYYVHARQKGEYTVLQYWAYHAYNNFLNSHNHDMELFSIYLKPDAQGKLQPAYLQTDWHSTFTMTPWSQLKLDSEGRPTVLVDGGSHEIRPLRRQDRLPAGMSLMPQGIWQDDKGQRSVTIHLKGDDPLVSGQEPVAPLKPGLDPRDAWYPGGSWVFGFNADPVAVGGGPRARELWYNPPHPAGFGFEAVPGQAVPGVASQKSAHP